jgi:hypothetical protein
MGQTFLDTRQSVNRAILPVLATAVNTQLSTILSDVNTELNVPLRMSASFPTPDANLNFASSLILAADGGQKSASPIGATVVNFPASTINFQLGTTTGGTFLPNSGAGTITLPTATVGYYVRAAFTLLASGSIQVIFSAPSASLGSLPNAGTLLDNAGIPIGWIDLQATASNAYKTANSSSNIIENAPGGTPAIHRFGSGAGAGSTQGTGSGIGDDLDSLEFLASFRDNFPGVPLPGGTVNVSAGFTNPDNYNASSGQYVLNYDATKTVTGTGTAMTLSAAPAFTMVAGDMLVVNSVAKRITTVNTQTSIVIESAFSTNPASAACLVSQAVYTVDLNNYAGTGQEVSALITSTISSILIDYGDSGFGTSTPTVAYTASSDGTNFSNATVRPDLVTDVNDTLSLPTSSTSLYLRFFANESSGSGTVTFNYYRVFFHAESPQDTTGGILNQAYTLLNGAGSQINCSPPTVVGGKSQIQLLNFTYVPGLNPGDTNGQLEIFINGQKIPRFVNGTTTPDAYYTEVSSSVIQLDSDYSSYAYAIDIIKPIAVQDDSPTNNLRLQNLYDQIVGSAAQVASGQATQTSLTAALAATPANGKILVLNYTSTETVNISQSVVIEGRGYASEISGNITFASGSSYSVMKNLKINGDVVFNSGTTAIFFVENWLTTGMTVTDGGTANYKVYTVG